jgi:hypothetical protein
VTALKRSTSIWLISGSVLVAACDRRAGGPTEPSAFAPSQSTATTIEFSAKTQLPSQPAGALTGLIGFVRNSVNEPLANAVVEVLDGPLVGLSSTTDPMGRYDVRGKFNYTPTVTIRARATGYHDLSRVVVLPTAGSGNTVTTDLFLRSTAPDVVVPQGAYTLTVNANCPQLPAPARLTIFDATISQSTANSYLISISGQEDSAIVVDGARLRLVVGSDTGLFNNLGAGSRVTILGDALATIATPTLGPLDVSLNGSASYTSGPGAAPVVCNSPAVSLRRQ